MRAFLAPALLLGCRAPAEAPVATSDLTGRISLSGAWALYPLAVRWADAFGALHPGVRLHVAAGGSGKGAVDVLDGFVDIGMLSREPTAEELARGAWTVPVAMDAVVAIASDRNPALSELRARGASLRELRALYGGGIADPTWSMLAPGSGQGPVRAYTRADACGTDRVFAGWLGLDPDALAGVGVYGDPGLVDVVERDPFGLGYTNASMAYDPEGGRPSAGLAVLPIDLDDDDAIGPSEASCASGEALAGAVREGRYPSALVRELRLLTRGAPTDPVLRAFVTWAVTDGQSIARDAGHLPLTEEGRAETRAKMEALAGG